MSYAQNPFIQKPKATTSHSSEWEEYQKKTISEFLQIHLPQHLADPNEDVNFGKEFQNGKILNALLDMLFEVDKSQQKRPSPNKGEKPPTRTSFKRAASTSSSVSAHTSGAFTLMYNRDNCQKAFARIRALGVKTNNIDAEDVVQGNSKMTQALLWKLIRHYDDLVGKFDINEEEITTSAKSLSLRRVSSQRDDSQEKVEVETPRTIEAESLKSAEDLLKEKIQKQTQQNEQQTVDPKQAQSKPLVPTQDKPPLKPQLKPQSKAQDKPPLKGSPRDQVQPSPRDQVQPSPRDQVQPSPRSLTTSPREPEKKPETSTSTSSNEVEESPRDMIAGEIYSTELSYAQQLGYLTKNYYPNLKPVCSDQEIKTIFSNITMIENFTSRFLAEIKQQVETPEKMLGNVFIKYAPFFKCYTKYFSDYEESCALTKQLMKKPDFEQAALQQKKSSGGLDLESLLITPVQRIPRYKLLLLEIIKHTPEGHPDRQPLETALLKISEMGTIVNESVSEGQRSKQQDNIIQQFPSIAPYISASRKFKKEIPKSQFSTAFRLGSNKNKDPKTKEGTVLVFSDMILTLHKKKVTGAYDISTLYFPKQKGEIFAFSTPIADITIKTTKDDVKFLAEVIEEGIEKLSVQKTKSSTTRKFRFDFKGISGKKTYDGEWKVSEPKEDSHGKMFFENGSVYEGNWSNGIVNGFGTMIYPTKSVYEGTWSDGNRNGQGSFTQGNSKYEGEWKDDKKHGKGKIHWANGDEFEGQFVKDKMEGYGTLKTSTGFHYSGEWAENMMDGRGTLKYPDGRTYEGEFGRDKRHGRGILTFPNGSSFDGKWSANFPQGEGEMTLKHANPSIVSHYKGHWQKGKRHGSGTLTVSNGPDVYLRYNGTWANDMFHGKGELFWNEATYKGEFYENHRVGVGTWKDCTGSYTGNWKANTQTGRGVLTIGEKYQIEGVFHVGLPSGLSSITTSTPDEKDSNNIQIQPIFQTNDNRVLLQSQGLLTPIQTSIALLPMTSFLL